MQQPHEHIATSAREFVVASVLFKHAVGKRLGLNITDNGCLNYLLIRGSASPAELATYTGLTTGSVTTMLDRLEGLGYIVRRPNPDDRRGLVVEITVAARQAIVPLTKGAQKAQIELMSRYSDDELAMIAQFIHAFAETIQHHAARLERGEQ
jgi:DNA-binding MarR family transcriptional regulator